ncbi:hypothetical protein TSUD_74450 [Trifolium subterraneum]|nr:hypothetical protein TSUD_74450 [Trifolium subterraneum]
MKLKFGSIKFGVSFGDYMCSMTGLKQDFGTNLYTLLDKLIECIHLVMEAAHMETLRRHFGIVKITTNPCENTLVCEVKIVLQTNENNINEVRFQNLISSSFLEH